MIGGVSELRLRRVLIFFCSFELGGAERQGMHLARYLKGLGCDVRVWGNLGGGLVEKMCHEAGIPWEVHRFLWPCRRLSLFRDGFKLARALRRLRPDVILPYTTWPNVGCGLTWRLSSAKACIWGQRNVNCLRGDAVERFAYRRVSHVVCNASHQVDYLQRILGATPASISVIYNGVELAPPQKPRSAWRAALGIDEAAPTAAMVANFRPQKDHPALLRAWRDITRKWPNGRPAPRLLLAGAEQQSYDSVRRLAGELGLLESVRFLGQVKDVSGLLAASDVGVLASNHEGLPNVVIEYMAAGLPVVATDLPGCREALGDLPDQPLCSVGCPESLAQRLRTLLSEPSRGKHLGEKNRLRAKSQFSLEAMCEGTMGVINGCLSAVNARSEIASRARSA